MQAPTPEGSTNPPSPSGDDLLQDRPVSVGRMLILYKLGEGGMGVVYAAYDPELDRKVAVKMIRPDRAAGPDGRTRLLREAQALARLSHPNVVGIYDVGTHGQQVWLAMEFVDGTTVRAWLKARRRSWREIVAVFKQAAQGIDTAHRAGLLHRDLKPTNIMIGDDERIRVMDFGLARDTVAVDSGEANGRLRATASELTQSGSVPGTPAYMAPEQFIGFPADERTDQFSFCVALWEALYGERPFADDSFVGRNPSVLASKTDISTWGMRIPRWLRKVVERGLAPRPEQRYASVAELLAALEASPTRRRAALGLSIAAALGTGGWIGVRQIAHEQAVEACESTGGVIDETWNDASRAGLHAALTRTGVVYATTTAEKTVSSLNDHAEALRTARIALCNATTVEGTLELALAEAEARCQEEQLLYFQSLVATLSDPPEEELGRGLVQSTGAAVATLLPPSLCMDEDWLRIRPKLPMDPASQGEIYRLRVLLARAGAFQAAGLLKQGIALTDEVLQDSEPPALLPIKAAAMALRGSLLNDLGEYKQSVEILEAAYFLAGSIGEDAVALDAAGRLAFVVGIQQQFHEIALIWSRTAQMILERADASPNDIRWVLVLSRRGQIYGALDEYDKALSDYTRALELVNTTLGEEHPKAASILQNMASTFKDQGKLDRAEEMHRQGLIVRENALGPAHPELANSINSLGNIQSMRGESAAAIDSYERARGIWEDALGPEHPSVALVLANLGNAYKRQRKFAEAIASYEGAREVFERVYGPDHPKVAYPLLNASSVYKELGDYERAAVYCERGVKIFEGKFGPESPEIAGALSNLGSIYDRQRRYDEAIAAHERARAIFENKFGPEDSRLGAVFNNLGMTYLEKGDAARSRDYYERALKIVEKVDGPDHPRLAISLSGIAGAALAQKQPGVAKPLLERAIELRRRTEDEPDRLAWMQFQLAQVLWSEQKERDNARRLAGEAGDVYRKIGVYPDELAEIERWIAQRVD